MNIDMIYSILAATIALAIPLIIGAYAGLYSERSGIINIGIEGMMIAGGFFGALGIISLKSTISVANNPFLFLLIACITGALGAALFALIHSYFTIKLKSNQVVTGIALNMLALSGTQFLSYLLFQQTETDTLGTLSAAQISFFKNSTNPLLKVINPFTIFVIIMIITTIFVFNKTRFGLRVKSVGENPYAAEAVGINVYSYRFKAVMISGILAGIAGVAVLLTSGGDKFSPAITINGKGFMALAILISGRWRPISILVAGLFFALLTVLPISLGIESLKQFNQFIQTGAPYLISLIALVFVSKNSKAPKSIGKVYEKAN